MSYGGPARDTEGMNPRSARGLALVVLLVAALAGCSRSEAPPGAAAMAPPPTLATGALAAARPSADRALIVTVNTSLRVANVNDATGRIRAEVESAGGYVASSNGQGGDNAYATMDLRVPGNQTTSLRKTLATLGDVMSEAEKVDDVTEQRADLAARLRSARTQETRLLTLMEQKAGTIGEVIEAEKELARVRDTVERLEAEQRTQESQITLSTIHVTLTTPSAAAWQTPGQSVASSWTAGVRGAKAIAVFFAMAAATVAPTMLPVMALGLLAFALLHRKKTRAVASRGHVR